MDKSKQSIGKNKGVTRRDFIERVGQIGGAAAVYETMTAMGLINKPTAWAGPAGYKKDEGAGKKVLILGGGVGGLTACYELERRGFQCMVLEAQNRLGGRSLTARTGSQVHEFDRPTQTCAFDDLSNGEQLYLNLGPGRLPYHHRRVLHYCQTLGVDLEIYVMNTTANLFQSNGAFYNQAQTYRQVDYDTRGYIAELLAKSVRRHHLDDELSPDERSQLLGLLKQFGALGQEGCDDYSYCGSNRTGCRFPNTIYGTEDCLGERPLPLSQILESGFWNDRFYQPDDFLWQPTLFQPVGGMDMVWRKMVDQISSPIHLNAIVEAINISKDEVAVSFTQNGATTTEVADYVVSNIPLPALQKIYANFSPDFQEAVDYATFAPSCKVGWQANQRFWENDQNQIYGGISWVNHNVTQIWYPSYQYFTDKGTMTGAYNFDERAIALGDMSLADRINLAREGGGRIHEQFWNDAIVPTSKALSIAWHRVPHQLGGWANWTDSPADRRAYSRLLAPDGYNRFYVVGDQVSSLPGWQEGAMMSAEHVVSQITNRSPLTMKRVVKAPESRALTQGML